MTDLPTTADIDLIQRLIPHRYPFLLVDRVIDIVPSTSATGIKNVTKNEPQFTGHYPSTPIFPGVLIVEACAQTACVLWGCRCSWRTAARLCTSWASTRAASAVRWCPAPSCF